MQLVGDIAKWEEIDGALVIEGIASTEDMDHAGDVIEADAIRKALPEYLRTGSVREMHTLAAGKPLAAFVDDEGRTHVKAKIVDSGTITKIKEGILKMFSIGGKTLRKEGNRVKELLLKEISVVDHGCNPKAYFSICKMEQSPSAKPTNMKDDLLKALQDPEVLAALKKIASPEPLKAEDLAKALQLDTLKAEIIEIKGAAKSAQEAAVKAERDALIAEASRDGKVIPLDNDDLAKVDVQTLRKMIEKLPKGLVTTKREQKVTLPDKGDELQKFLETKRAEGAEVLGRLIKSQLTPTLN